MKENNKVNKDNNNLENLKALENSFKNEGTQEDNSEIINNTPKESDREFLGDYKLPNTIDGYRYIPNDELPFGGALYPKTWRFAYRCPTSLEVANFSTINEEDQPAIISAVEDLIKRCYIIVDSDKNNEVSTDQINDGERLFFFLKLREFYLYDKPITYLTMNQTYQEPVTISLLASILIYPELNEKLINCFDGRKFTISYDVNQEPIVFLIPTLNTSAKIFRFMIKTYKEIQKDESDKVKNSSAFDKQFLLIAPYLYVNGDETIISLQQKFKAIQKNPTLLNAYITIINKLKLNNYDKIVYTYKESEEEALIKFPGGWKQMFIDKGAFGGIFE
jgi:hypothetical protein